MTEVLAAVTGAIKLAAALDFDGIVRDLAEVARRWGASDEDLNTAIEKARQERAAIIAAGRKAEWP